MKKTKGKRRLFRPTRCCDTQNFFLKQPVANASILNRLCNTRSRDVIRTAGIRDGARGLENAAMGARRQPQRPPGHR